MVSNAWLPTLGAIPNGCGIGSCPGRNRGTGIVRKRLVHWFVCLPAFHVLTRIIAVADWAAKNLELATAVHWAFDGSFLQFLPLDVSKRRQAAIRQLGGER